MAQEKLLDLSVQGGINTHSFDSPDLSKEVVALDMREKTSGQDMFSQYLNVSDHMNSLESSLTWVDSGMNTVEHLPRFERQSDSALMISNKIKEKGKFILPLKQKKVSDKLKLLKESRPEADENLVNMNHFPAKPLSTLNLRPNRNNTSSQLLSSSNLASSKRSDSEVDQTSHSKIHIFSPQPKIEQEFSNSAELENGMKITSRRDSLIDNSSDIEDGNEVEHSSSPTIPVDSPSMHVFSASNDESEYSNINNSSDKFQHQFMAQPGQIFQEPPTFANAEVNKSVRNPASTNKTNISFSIATNPIESQKNTFTPSTPEDKVVILKLLRDGIRDYSSLLTDFSENMVVENRSDYLVSYVKRFDYELKPKLINDYLGEIRKDKISEDVKQILNNDTFCEEVKQLLIESDKRRKCYNKRKSARSSESKKSSPVFTSTQSTPLLGRSSTFANVTTDTSAPSSAKSTTVKLLPKVEASKPEKSRAIVINLIRIGSFINQRQLKKSGHGNENLVAIADLRNIAKKNDDERYIHKLRATNTSLKMCVEDIYGPNANFTHSLAYSRIPLSLDPLTSINLENDQMISYVEILLDVSKMLIPGNRSINSSLNYASILQLKSVTRIYSEDRLVYRRCDPITGFFTKDNVNVAKIILPLQAKLWANLINDYHNGIINDSKVSALKITHTLFPNDDILRFKSGGSAIYSFVWEFVINVDGHYLPHCVNIEKLTPSTNNFAKVNVQSVANSELKFGVPQPHAQFQQNSTSLNYVAPPNLGAINLPSHQQSSQKHIAPTKTQSLRRAVTHGTINIAANVKTNNNLDMPIDNFNVNLNNPPPAYSRSNSALNNTSVSSMVTSTPLLTQRKREDLGRGHKRTRSRSMNEIDLMSLPLSFDGFMNMPFLDSFSPTESSSSPLVKQNIPYLKSQSVQHLHQQQLQPQPHLQQPQQLQHSSSLHVTQPQPQQQQWQALKHSNGIYSINPNMGGHGYGRPVYQPIMEYKHFNNSDSQLELNNFHSSFEEATANSLVINTAPTHISPKQMAFSIESLDDSIKTSDSNIILGNDNISNNNNNNNSTSSTATKSTITNNTNWSKLPTIPDVSLYASSSSAMPTSFDFDENSKAIAELSVLSEIPELTTPQPNQKLD